MSAGTYLIDTHILLWFAAGDEKLSAVARGIVEDSSNEIVISDVCVWEISIKWSIGKLTLPMPPAQWIPAVLQRCSIQTLPVRTEHALAVSELPFHHRDPFDRLLVAQSLIEGHSLISADVIMDAYGVSRIF